MKKQVPTLSMQNILFSSLFSYKSRKENTNPLTTFNNVQEDSNYHSFEKNIWGDNREFRLNVYIYEKQHEVREMNG